MSKPLIEYGIRKIHVPEGNGNAREYYLKINVPEIYELLTSLFLPKYEKLQEAQ